MAYKDKYGVEFSDDRKTLVKCPEDFHGAYTIPDGVTSIGNYAFKYCSGLTSVSISNGVTRIGREAFFGCYRMKNITIPNSITRIEDFAFANSGLLTVSIPNSVTSIGSNAFANSHLTSVEIPNSITSIGECVFSSCSDLTSVEIPDSVKWIEEGAFMCCKKLLSIDIPNSVTSIKKEAFWNCSQLSGVEIPKSVISIGDGAFARCSGLLTMSIPNSVTSIGSSAFACCFNLTNVNIHNGLTNIGKGAFDFCSSLKEIIVPKGQKTRFGQMEGLKDLKDKIVEASIDAQKPRTWEEVNAEYRAYFEKRQKENPNIQNKNGGTPLEFPPFGIELSIQEYSQFKKEGRTIHSWMFWCKSGKEIHELARLYGPIGGIGLSTPRQGYYKVVEIEGEGNDARLVCYYNLFSSNEFLEEEDEKVRVKQKPLFNKRSSCAGPIEIGDIVHVKSTELVEDIYDGRTYQAYKIIWEFV